jgi:hypothetical protein
MYTRSKSGGQPLLAGTDNVNLTVAADVMVEHCKPQMKPSELVSVSRSQASKLLQVLQEFPKKSYSN